MTSHTRSQKTYLKKALDRGAINVAYDARPYQLTAATKSISEIQSGRHSVLTLPTGTGKTVICGMSAALFLKERPKSKVLFTAPRRALLNQLHDRSIWINPTFPSRLVGMDPREDGRHVRASFSYARLIFGMPEFLRNRLIDGSVPGEMIDQVGLLIIDEFDHFLTLRYRARDVAVEFHAALDRLLESLPEAVRILLVSATTPEIVEPNDQKDDIDSQIDASAQSAFRQFLDTEIDPAYITIAERYYREFIPHARITAVAICDKVVVALDAAMESETGLLLNWISGTVGYHINADYVIPRLPQIVSGRLSLLPGAKRPTGSPLGGLLGRLLWLIHLGDFVYEDMAEGVDWHVEETSIFDETLAYRKPITATRVDKPQTTADNEVMQPAPGGKFDFLMQLLRRRKGEKGVVFFRYVRILEYVERRLRSQKYSPVVVHGKRQSSENNAALDQFRKSEKCLLLITRDTGKRGLDLPEADFAVFYSPKSREDVTWQEVSRIRSTVHNPKDTYILFYAHTREQDKAQTVLEALERTTHSKEIGVSSAIKVLGSIKTKPI